MTSMRRGAKALGLFLSLCGVMAVFAAGAQGNWLVEGAELTTNETVAVKAASTLKIVVAAKNLEIQCTTAASEGLKLIAKSATAEGKIKFSSCKAFSPPGSGKESKNCNPKEPIVAGGKVLIILHNGINYLLYEPAAGGTKFTTIEFPELCALTETSDVTGSAVFECGHLNPPGTWLILDCATAETSHEAREAPSALFPSDTVKFGANAATISGYVVTELAGANAGKNWAGHV